MALLLTPHSFTTYSSLLYYLLITPLLLFSLLLYYLLLTPLLLFSLLISYTIELFFTNSIISFTYPKAIPTTVSAAP